MAIMTSEGSLPIALDGARQVARQPHAGPHPLGDRGARSRLRASSPAG